jgi:hypothetical protein
MPKHPLDDEAAPLFDVSVLFIPFDAKKKFYKANAVHGVKGVITSYDKHGNRVAGPALPNTLVPTMSRAGFFDGPEIGKHLAAIVQQECDLIRNIHESDRSFDERLGALLAASGPHADLKRLTPNARNRVERNLRGYKHYPTFIFLSENPTGSPFPERIDTSGLGANYLRKHVIDGSSVKGVRHANEIALYLREDHDRLFDTGDMFLETRTLIRDTQGLSVSKSKDEYILKVTLGRRHGASFTVAGVHLRAALASSSASDREKERQALRDYCAAEGIQLMVGDFNMDVQETPFSSRGAYADDKPENAPIYLLPWQSSEASPQYLQQFSNSTGNAHYMGYLQADEEALQFVGQGLYGIVGVSGSRFLKAEDKYYSDHPSIYLAARSTRVAQ